MCHKTVIEEMCDQCEGSGFKTYWDQDADGCEGSWHDPTTPCPSCDGRGFFPVPSEPLELEDLVPLIPCSS